MATSGRFCSAAHIVFFIADPQTLQKPIDRRLPDLDASLAFHFPATRKFDRTAPATPIAEGVYSGSAELRPGRWDVEVSLNRGGKRMFLSHNNLLVE